VLEGSSKSFMMHQFNVKILAIMFKLSSLRKKILRSWKMNTLKKLMIP